MKAKYIIYYTQKEACVALDVSEPSIRRCLRDENRIVKGHRLKYLQAGLVAAKKVKEQ